jgi:hypothetical protein
LLSLSFCSSPLTLFVSRCVPRVNTIQPGFVY